MRIPSLPVVVYLNSKTRCEQTSMLIGHVSLMRSGCAICISPQLRAVQIQEMVAAQRWAVQAFCRTEMSKLMSIARDLHRERQAHVPTPSPIEARCLLVCLK